MMVDLEGIDLGRTMRMVKLAKYPIRGHHFKDTKQPSTPIGRPELTRLKKDLELGQLRSEMLGRMVNTYG